MLNTKTLKRLQGTRGDIARRMTTLREVSVCGRKFCGSAEQQDFYVIFVYILLTFLF